VEKRRIRRTDASTPDAEKVADIRRLDNANEQLAKLTSCTELTEEPGSLVDSDPNSPAPPDRRRSALYGHYLSRLTGNSRSSSTSSLPLSIQSEDSVQIYDTALTATIAVLRLASDLADMAPVPGLKGAVATALNVAELIAVGDKAFK
jgi:hypothetical protein